MSTYSFVMEVSGFNPEQDQFIDVLYGTGCDDALIVIDGDRLILDFDRESRSLESAIMSARSDVERAGGKVLRVELPED